MKKYHDTTQHELEALKHRLNLSDAHTHQKQSWSQRGIIRRLGKLWYKAEKNRQVDAEQEFLQNFFHLRRQPTALAAHAPQLVYASSIAMVMVANYLLKKQMSVSLLHPCFDNIIHIMRHMNLDMLPLEEELLHDSRSLYENLSGQDIGDAIMVVDPNNPTGFSLDSHNMSDSDRLLGWTELIRFAVDHNKLLIIDTCFSLFSHCDPDFEPFDLYKMLDESGVDYVVIEDTGKIWPLQDTKVAAWVTSDSVFADLYDIHTSYLLNVSPFVLNIVNEYVLDAKKTNFSATRTLLSTNRAHATVVLEDTILKPITGTVATSVLWCEIKDDAVQAEDLKAALESKDLHILPGTLFFWQGPKRGQKYIRIALARDKKLFQEAMKMLRSESLHLVD